MRCILLAAAFHNAFHAPHVELELAKLLVITCPGKLDW